MTLAVVAKNAAKGIQLRSPMILTGFAVGGLVSTAVLTARAAVKANEILVSAEVEQIEADQGLTTRDKIRLVWTQYIPPFIVGASTITCIIGAQSINARRQAALAGAFMITENAFQEYKDQVVDSFGSNKEKKVRDDVVQKKVTENPPPENLTILESGNVLCVDTYTGRYFESTIEKIRKAQNDFNEGLLNGEMYLSLNEFYHYLGIPDVVVGEAVGFSPENMINLQFSSALTPEGRPCLAIEFRALPRQDYFRFQ